MPESPDIRAKLETLGKRNRLLLSEMMARIDQFETLQTELQWLREHLAAVDRRLAKDLRTGSLPAGESELIASLAALGGLLRFLRFYAPSNTMMLLKTALVQFALGSQPAMFRPPRGRHRSAEGPLIHQIKGAIAGLTHVQQRSGMNRKAAAEWVARNIASGLAARLSSKAITARTILEWLERYGGKHPPKDLGGGAFKIWSLPPPFPLTTQKFRQITRDFAEMVPSRG